MINESRSYNSNKGEILYASQWFCIVGLRAHGLGHLAFMPLFRNDFTQLNACGVSMESRLVVPVEAKIKREQLLRVSAAVVGRDEQHLACYCVGQVGKVCVEAVSGRESDYCIVVHDLTTLRQSRKSMIR